MDKDKKRALRRHRLIWRIIYLPFYILCRLFFNYRFKPVGQISPPYIVVANHSNAWDQFLVSLPFGPGGHMYFLASEHIFRNARIASLINWLAAPISRTKGGSDASAVMSMLRWLKNGVSVCLFPEGENTFNGRTGPMHPSTAKLLKKAGVPVVTFRITGGHLSLPRWAHSRRRGIMEGTVAGIYRPEQLRDMSTDEINELLEHDLRVDAFASQKDDPVAYKGRRLAEGLEQFLYLCPVCGAVDSFKSSGSSFTCSRCGLSVTYDVYGSFDEKAPFRDPASWDDWQERRLDELCAAGGVVFSDGGAVLRRVEDGHVRTPAASGAVSLDASALHVGELSFPLSGMPEPSMCNFAESESLLFSPDGHERYELCLTDGHSIRKYHRAMEHLLSRGEG